MLQLELVVVVEVRFDSVEHVSDREATVLLGIEVSIRDLESEPDIFVEIAHFAI